MVGDCISDFICRPKSPSPAMSSGSSAVPNGTRTESDSNVAAPTPAPNGERILSMTAFSTLAFSHASPMRGFDCRALTSRTIWKPREPMTLSPLRIVGAPNTSEGFGV